MQVEQLTAGLRCLQTAFVFCVCDLIKKIFFKLWVFSHRRRIQHSSTLWLCHRSERFQHQTVLKFYWTSSPPGQLIWTNVQSWRLCGGDAKFATATTSSTTTTTTTTAELARCIWNSASNCPVNILKYGWDWPRYRFNSSSHLLWRRGAVLKTFTVFCQNFFKNLNSNI